MKESEGCQCLRARLPLVVQRGGHGVERGADRLGAVPDEQQLGQTLLSALGREAGVGVLVPAVLHGLLQRAHRLQPAHTHTHTHPAFGLARSLPLLIPTSLLLLLQVFGGHE